MRIGSLRQIGGVNSIDSFARSFQRAAGFRDLTPLRRGSVAVVEPGDVESGQEVDGPSPAVNKSLLTQQLESAGSEAQSEASREEFQRETAGSVRNNSNDDQMLQGTITDLFSYISHSSHSQGHKTTYGTPESRGRKIARRRASQLFQERREAVASEADKEIEPLLIKQVQRNDGTRASIVVGQSTLYQTIFNSINVLIGVGLLSLPLALKYTGWIVGLLFLTSSALVTAYTAKVLSVCLDVDPSLVTYADIAFISFGRRARIIVSVLFSLELVAACVALVILFADSLNALVPQVGLSTLDWKIICGFVLIPLNFVPLRLLSITSILGIVCCTFIVIAVLVDGFIKPNTPGSLREPAATRLFPSNWTTLPLGIGLLMSPWGGHSVFPNIYKDMRHPLRYGKALRFTYGFTFSLDACMAIVGLLMFGDDIRDEVTSNVLLIKGYPRGLSIIIVVMIAIIPLTKIPLR